MRVDLPIDAHVPHDYVDTERLRLDVYRKIAEARDDATRSTPCARSSSTATASPRCR